MVFGDEGFDALELFAGSMMFVQVNTEAFSVEAGARKRVEFEDLKFSFATFFVSLPAPIITS